MRNFKQYISAESIGSVSNTAKPNNAEYNKFISSTLNEIKRGYSVIIFKEEHLEYLKEYFGDNLGIIPNKKQNYWTCFLKDYKRK